MTTAPATTDILPVRDLRPTVVALAAPLHVGLPGTLRTRLVGRGGRERACGVELPRATRVGVRDGDR